MSVQELNASMAKGPRTNNAGLYSIFLPILRDIARQRGYALGIHGSMLRDCDLIAAPWTADAVPPGELIEALRVAVNGTMEPPPYITGSPEERPHGRLGYCIFLGGGPYFDISVMPRIEPKPPPRKRRKRR